MAPPSRSEAPWARVKELFEAVADAPMEQQESLLETLCGDDPGLRAEVQSLLEADRRASDDLMIAAARELSVSLLAELPPSLAGRRVGAWQVVRELGRGGMGNVYLAYRDDDTFLKLVALKVIRPEMDTEAVVHRFANERRILAQLEHPNVARLIDGGTVDGRPFFVMEYVDGLPIDTFCRNGNLDLEDRLRLFLQVCAAVEYAHRNLIVHRDLKPTNILVTEDHVPKLLDFGIAALLEREDSADAATVAELRMFTPEYASPEQISGRVISTVSDVYSLGVVLYEILAGCRPFSFSSHDQADMLRDISGRGPERPSVAGRRNGPGLPGVDSDLDRIVLKAIAPEPEQRYGSARQLAEDVERKLSGLPVAARGNGLWYRARKFVGRNRIGVIAATALLAILLGGVVATRREAANAEARKIEAQRRLGDVRRIANSLIFELHDSLARVPGTLAARQLIVQRALQYLDELDRASGGDPSIKAELAGAYDHVGLLTFDTRRAVEMHRRAVAIFRDLATRPATRAQYAGGLALSLVNLADVERVLGDYQASIRDLAEAERCAALVRLNHPEEVRNRVLIEDIHFGQGAVFEETGQWRLAVQSYLAGLRIASDLSAGKPNDPSLGQRVMLGEAHLGTCLGEEGTLAEALLHERKALAIAENLAAGEPLDGIFKRDLWSVHRRMGVLLLLSGRPSEAVKELRQADDIITSLAAADPGDDGELRSLALTSIDLGDALAELDPQGALAKYEKARRISSSLVRNDPSRLEAICDLAEVETAFGRELFRQGHRTEAREHFHAAGRLADSLQARRVDNPRILHGLARGWGLLAKQPAGTDLEAESEAGRLESAARNAEQSLIAASAETRIPSALSPAAR